MRKLSFLLLIFLLSCSEVIVKTKVISFDVNEKANSNSPIALDLVIIYQSELLAQIVKLDAKTWFEKRDQFQRDNPAELFTWGWEVVPGQMIPFFKLPSASKEAKGVLVFANYTTPGVHRARLDPYEGVIVWLLEYDFLVEPLVKK